MCSRPTRAFRLPPGREWWYPLARIVFLDYYRGTTKRVVNNDRGHPVHQQVKSAEAMRLEHIRLKRAEGSPSLREFHRRLTEDGRYDISYQSVQKYHQDRPVPAHYMAQVARVFGVDAGWLVTGEGRPSVEFTHPAMDTVRRHWSRYIGEWDSADTDANAVFAHFLDVVGRFWVSIRDRPCDTLADASDEDIELVVGYVLFPLRAHEGWLGAQRLSVDAARRSLIAGLTWLLEQMPTPEQGLTMDQLRRWSPDPGNSDVHAWIRRFLITYSERRGA